MSRLVLFAASFLLAMQWAHSQENQWTVDGTVTANGGPVDGARVIVSGPDKTPDASIFAVAETDAKGHYSVKGIAAGYYLVYASKDGFAPSPLKSAQVLAGNHLESIDFRLDKEAVISGRVLDVDKNPVQGATVSACVKAYRDGRLRLQFKESATTNDLGEYRIANLGEGRYFLVVSPRKLSPQKASVAANRAGKEPKRATILVRRAFYPGVESLDSAAPVRIYQGEQHGGADIVVPKANSFCVRATIVATGEPASSSIWLFQPVGDTFPTVASGVVKAGDVSEICGITPGNYRLLASISDPETRKITAFTQTDVAVDKRDVDAGNLYPRQSTTMRGVVTIKVDSNDVPIPSGVTIELLRRGRPILYGETLRTSVANDGGFTLADIFADDYGLSVEGLPNGYYVRSAQQQGVDVRRGIVRPDRGDLLISLAPDSGTIHGKAVDKENNAVPNATILLVSADRSVVMTRLSDASGSFQFDTGIAPGKYQIVAVTHVLEGEATDPLFVERVLSAAAKVEVAERSAQFVTLTIHENYP